MNTRSLPLATLVGFLAFAWLAGRPAPKPTAEAATAEAPPTDDARQAAWFRYEHLTRLVAEAATPSQQEAIRQAHDDVRFASRQTAASAEPGWRDLQPRLRGDLPTLRVRWSDRGVELEALASPLPLARGLPRFVLVELTNLYPEGQLVRAAFDGVEAGYDPVPIPPGATQPLVVPVVVREGGPKRLRLMVETKSQARPVEVPVQVTEPATVRGRLIDADVGKVFPGRVFALGSDRVYRPGKAYADVRTLSEKQLLQFAALKFYKLPFFYSDGNFEVTLPPGEATLTLERGFEQAVVTERLTLKPGETRDVTLRSGRLVDMKSLGWVSGDTHIHWVTNYWKVDEPLELLAMVQRAEDLRVANNLLLMHRTENDAFIKPSQAPMGPVKKFCDGDHHIQMGEEYRNEDFYGHLCFLNLKHLVLPISTGPMIAGPDALDYPINKTAILACREQGGISVEAHGLGRNADVPVNVIHGLTDSLDQIEPDDYYRLLDCGFRLPLTNGSDHPARVAGCARAYVKVEGGFSYEKWIDGIRKARTFTTSGPLLFLSVNGKDIGEALDVKRGDRVKIVARAVSRRPLGRVQVVANGEVIREVQTKETSATLEVEKEVSEGCWVVARCSPSSTFNALMGPDVAHTSAVYVTVEGRPAIRAGAARLWAERMRRKARDLEVRGRFANAAQRAEAVGYVLAGVARFEALAEKAEPAWPAAPKVEAQPLLAQVKRVRQALETLGQPLPAEATAALGKLRPDGDAAAVTREVEKRLDPLCLAAVDVGGGGKLSVVAAKGKTTLVEQGWRAVLVKVVNRTGARGALRLVSPNARPLPHSPAAEVASRWLDLVTYTGQPLLPDLSGLELEYRVVQLYARDAGEHHAVLAFGLDGANGAKAPRSAVRDWRFDGGADGWKALNQCKLQSAGGALTVTSEGHDPFFAADVTAKPGEYVLRFWAKFDRPGVGQLFWRTREQPAFDGGRQVNFLLQPGRAAEYEVRFQCEGNLAGVRLDPGSEPGVTRFDWITLSREDASDSWPRATVGFDVARSVPLTFRVLEADGSPTTGAFLIRDAEGRVYPAQSKRLAPDLFFQPQVYRATGEQVRLPRGKYTVRCWRGPESLPETKTIEIADTPVTLVYQVKRWTDPARRGWYSGDHHIHAAGCLHYEKPTEGVLPEHMMRYTVGEDLKVGCCLTWGPCFDFQKRFFTGKPDDVSKPPYLLRYDVEVSGFGSHQSGHLNLLNLKEQIPPGGTSKHHWPTLGLNTLRWAKRQGAVCGPAHSSIGLTRFVGRTPGKDGPNGLPNFNLPAYDGIGANEFVVDVTHEVPGPDGKPVPAVDFLSTMNTDRVAEWNMWYHVLNCGYRVRASGETDFPCMSGERVGIGRVYVKVDGPITWDKWVRGVADGRSYVSDGVAHLWDFHAGLGEQRFEMGVGGSELRLAKPGKVAFTCKAQVRVEGSPTLPVELVVNGYPAGRQEIVADGAEREFRFDVDVRDSSWVAVRLAHRAHTNPIFVLVEGRAIRASADSAEWCLRGVEQCWKEKKPTYLGKELAEAEAAYEHARRAYRRVKAEAEKR